MTLKKGFNKLIWTQFGLLILVCNYVNYLNSIVAIHLSCNKVFNVGCLNFKNILKFKKNVEKKKKKKN